MACISTILLNTRDSQQLVLTNDQIENDKKNSLLLTIDEVTEGELDQTRVQ
jgi:hypothetical protein